MSSTRAAPDAFMPSPIALIDASVSPLASRSFTRLASHAVSEGFMYCRIGREKPKYCFTFFGSGVPIASRAARAAASPFSFYRCLRKSNWNCT